MPFELKIPHYVSAMGKSKVSLLYHLTWRGFCTEMIWLSNAYLFSAVHGYKFLLHSRNWIGCTEKGWQDYFVPFFDENNDARMDISSPYPRRSANNVELSNLINYLHFRLVRRCRGIIPTPLFYNEMRAEGFLRRYFDLPKHHILGDIFHARAQLLKEMLNYNESTRAHIDAGIRAVIPANTLYIGLHVRRGDKVNGPLQEGPLTSTKQYMDKVKQENKGVKTVFVATDDYSVFSELEQSFPEFDFVTLCDPARRGYSQIDARVMTIEERKREILSILLDIEILRNATLVIGTYSSSVGKLLAKIGSGRFYSVDYAWTPF